MGNVIDAYTNNCVDLEYRIFNSVKESLGYESSESITVYNTRIESYTLELSNGEKHLIYIDKNQYDFKGLENILDSIQNTIFGSGKMYDNRYKQWKRRVKQLKLDNTFNKDGENTIVSIITVASVLMASKIKITCKYNTYSIMSELSYWLDSTKTFSKLQ